MEYGSDSSDETNVKENFILEDLELVASGNILDVYMTRKVKKLYDDVEAGDRARCEK